MKTAREILNDKYKTIGAYNMDDTHRIAAMMEYALQVADAVRQECFNEWGDKNMQDPDTVDIDTFII